MSKIVRLEASNVKRLKAVEITPEGNLVVIKGRNGAGKTSCLDAITYALGGRDVHPPKVIRDGESSARVVLELDDLVVERRWTAKGTYLEVRSHAGAKYSSPQAMLDRLVGSLSFDPLAFTRLDKKRQVETLRALVGIDFSELDRQRQEAFDQRTPVNREVKGLQAQLDRMPAPTAGTPADEVSVADLVQEQQRLLGEKAENDRVRQKLEMARNRQIAAAHRVEAARQAVEDLRRRLAEAEAEVQRRQTEADDLAREAASLDMQVDGLVDPDLSGIAERIRTVEQTNAAVRRAAERRTLEQKLAQRSSEAETLSTAIAVIDAQKQDQLAAAKFPVPGLGFADEGITLNDLPLEQASAAEQLRVSLGMGLALNPELRVMLIRDGSLLDEESMRLVAEMAEAAGAQVWVEVVSSGEDGVGIVIEDGQVRAPKVASSVSEAVEVSR